ncbi:MAG: prepilin-type N-terminal cleavage/methylation domain-containing protein [Candidatus Omnitrophota bacterium]|nr:prepilin-type N-terminal cleavage/methylation domain-containing protein [Candidatus Omnitrophota bacterium]MDZ4242741.1 prepilin-type N-terminal cleavage/methylation domain-containing protein [Candidatus Omnitrophota bacterium]
MRLWKKSGFTLVEMLMSAAILSLVMAGGYMIFAAGENTWFTTEVSIRLQENLRKSLDRMFRELHMTQTGQFQILDAAGSNNSDAVRFSIPVVCHAGDLLIDAGGNVAHWGAPLTWGCAGSACMDADDDCGTVDYKSLEYRLNSDNQLVRRVLNAADSVIREDIFAERISDLQITVNGRLMVLQLTTTHTADNGRVLTAQAGTNIYLRN